MVIVLSISILVVGGALSQLYFSRDEAKLNDAYQSIEVMAKRARTIATLQQRPYALEFTDKTVSLMPFAEATLDVRDREDLLEEIEDREDFAGFDDGESTEASAVQSAVRDSWNAEPEMSVFIKRWATTEWIEVKKRDRHIWRFDPNGTCEPIAVRVEVNESWVQVAFHPLTGAIRDIESDIK